MPLLPCLATMVTGNKKFNAVLIYIYQYVSRTMCNRPVLQSQISSIELFEFINGWCHRLKIPVYTRNYPQMCFEDKENRCTRDHKRTELWLALLGYLFSYWFLSHEISQKDTAIYCACRFSSIALWNIYLISLMVKVIQ